MGKKLTKWWEMNVKENEDELIEMGGLASRALMEKLNIEVGPKTAIGFYVVVFDEITKMLKEAEDKHDQFMINIANRLEIGYTSSDDTDDDDAEKLNLPFQLNLLRVIYILIFP